MEAENEVFELCEQVYKATGWKNTEDGFFDGGEVMPFTDRIGAYIGASNFRCPLYTSDYLLEKLPSVVQDPYDKIFRHIQMWINGDRSAHAGYVEPYAHDDRVAYAQKSDEMRITLLKLTLKLHEEGLL